MRLGRLWVYANSGEIGSFNNNFFTLFIKKTKQENIPLMRISSDQFEKCCHIWDENGNDNKYTINESKYETLILMEWPWTMEANTTIEEASLRDGRKKQSYRTSALKLSLPFSSLCASYQPAPWGNLSKSVLYSPFLYVHSYLFRIKCHAKIFEEGICGLQIGNRPILS